MIVIVWLLDLQLPMKSVPIITKGVSPNPAHGLLYSIQHYVIKFVSDLRQVGGFLQVLRCPPLIKTDRHDIAEILLEVALDIITLTTSGWGNRNINIKKTTWPGAIHWQTVSS